jgi:tight adherence protein B
VRTLTAQGRLARWILTALPLVVALAVFVLNGDAVRPLYQSSVGQLFLVAGALMLVAGSLVIQRIVDIDV